MAYFPDNARLRDPNSCVEISPIVKWVCAFLRRLRPSNHPHVRNITPRHARDIGLTESDMAVHRHRLPSQNTHHPYG